MLWTIWGAFLSVELYGVSFYWSCCQSVCRQQSLSTFFFFFFAHRLRCCIQCKVSHLCEESRYSTVVQPNQANLSCIAITIAQQTRIDEEARKSVAVVTSPLTIRATYVVKHTWKTRRWHLTESRYDANRFHGFECVKDIFNAILIYVC